MINRFSFLNQSNIHIFKRLLSTHQAAAPPVLSERQGQAHIFTLNRPKALNALNWEMVNQLHPLYTSLEQDARAGLASAPSVVVLRGSGAKAFCAGGDVVEITTAPASARKVHFFRDEYRLIYGISRMLLPHVSVIDGITMGGGCGVSLNGAFRVATERTTLAMPEASIGFFCDVGGSHFLSRLSPALPGLAPYLGLTAGRLSGADVFHAGLATHFVRSERVEALVAALAGLRRAEGAGGDEGARRARLHGDVREVLAQFQEREVPDVSFRGDLPAIKEAFEVGSLEHVVVRLTEMSARTADPHHAWAQKTLKKVMAGSPTSLRIIWEQLHQGRHWNLAETLQREYNIAQAYMSREFTSDFIEGVRAVLVDKDNAPKWNPVHLSDTSHTYAMRFFDYQKELIELKPFC